MLCCAYSECQSFSFPHRDKQIRGHKHLTWRDIKAAADAIRSLRCHIHSHHPLFTRTRHLFLSPGLILSHPLHSCWRTSRTSCAPTSPCTLTRRSWSCLSSPPPAAAACAPCRCTSRLPFVLLESTSSDRATHSRPSSLCAPGPWRCWKMAWCWPFSVR